MTWMLLLFLPFLVWAQRPYSPSLGGGQKLYKKVCSKCHGSLSSSAKIGRTSEDITWAVKNIPLMEKGKSLSQNDMRSLEMALNVKNINCAPLVPQSQISQLTQQELKNTIRDLTGIQLEVSSYFPQVSKEKVFANDSSQYNETYSFTQERLKLVKALSYKIMKGSKQSDKIQECLDVKSRKCLKEFLTSFTRRVQRRPFTGHDFDDYFKNIPFRSDDLRESLISAIQKSLLSPYFFNKIIASPTKKNSTKERAYEIANRLSYFLWSSSPDDILFDKAESKKIFDSKVLDKEINRMLENPKSEALFRNFFLEWSETDIFLTKDIDPNLFPGFSFKKRKLEFDHLRQLYDYVKNQERSIKNFLDPDPPQILASESSSRVGLLTTPAWLTAHSHPTESSVTRRGKFIREQLLCNVLIPPIGKDKEGEKFDFEFSPGLKMTGKEQMNQHVSLSSCANCHQMMDPLGVAFENFNGIGAWREKQYGQKIDPKISFPGFGLLKNGIELQKKLSETNRFKDCFVRKMTAYAINRPIKNNEVCKIVQIREKAERENLTFASIVREISLSSFFFQEKK